MRKAWQQYLGQHSHFDTARVLVTQMAQREGKRIKDGCIGTFKNMCVCEREREGTYFWRVILVNCKSSDTL